EDMKRKALWLGLLFSLPAYAYADGAPAERPIAIVKSKVNENYNRFVAGLAVESKLRYVEYTLDAGEDEARKLYAKIKADAPPLVVAIGTLAARLARELLAEIPVVFAMVPNHEKYNLQAENVTGIALAIPLRQQFATLKILAPNTKNVGVMYNPRHTKALVDAAVEVAKAQGLTIVPAKIDSPDEVPDASRAFLGTIDALWMVPDQSTMNTESFKHLLKFTFKNKVPFFSVAHKLVENGALVSLS